MHAELIFCPKMSFFRAKEFLMRKHAYYNTRACGSAEWLSRTRSLECSEETLLTQDDTVFRAIPSKKPLLYTIYLALNLRLPKDVVEEIHVAHEKPGHRLRRVVEEVLSRGSSATWRDIVDALRHPEVNMSPLANTIEARFPDPVPEPPSG